MRLDDTISAPLVAKSVDQRHAETVPFATRHQKGWAALPVLAEMEVEAGHRMADAEASFAATSMTKLSAEWPRELTREGLLHHGGKTQLRQQLRLHRAAASG